MATRTNGKSAADATKRTFKTSIDVPPDARAQICEILNLQLADTTDLFTQLKHAHWNVKGPEFYQLHKLYDELAACTLEWSDEIAADGRGRNTPAGVPARLCEGHRHGA